LDVAFEELEEKLKSLLGLSGYEARVYLALLSRGRMRPIEAAREAGIPVQRVYDVLRRLEEKGLVVSDAEGAYRAADPERAFGSYASKLVLEALRRSEEVRRLAEEVKAFAKSAGREYVLLVRGVEDSIAHAIEALRGCGEKPVFMAYKALEKLGELWPLLEKLLESLPGGATVLVPRGVRIPREYLESAGRYGVEVVESEAVIMDLMVACDTVIIGLPSRGHNVVSVVVRSPEFARALRERLVSMVRGG
jgi:sugar-specific transcriptional regulator TrmB